MAKENTTETNLNFENCSNVVALSPKVSTEKAFVYRSQSDLKNLIAFVGKKPTIDVTDNGDIIPKFKKQEIKPGMVVFRNSFGEVTRTMKIDEASKNYEIKGSRTFAQEDINKVVEKERKERKSKDDKK